MRFALMIFFTLLSSQSQAVVHKFTLDNGLKILVKEDHRAPVAVSIIWYNVGSADEPGGLTGVSHALEHLMFKGTSKYAAGSFSKIIAGVGGQENAFTSYDYTAYYEKMAAAQLPVSFELEADRMQNLLLNQKEFAKEIKVIQEERRMRTDDNPQALTMERYMAAANLSDPYHHPVVGWMSDLQQMTVADARAWYRNFYSPDNAVLVVAGDVQPKKVKELAQLYFGGLQRHPDYNRKKQTPPPGLGPKSVDIHAPAKVPLLISGFTVPGVNTAQQAWEPYALEVIAGILDAGESSRLTRNLVRGNRTAASVGVQYNMYTRYPTQFVFYGIPAKLHSLADVKAGIMKEIKRLQTEPVSEMELNRIKTQIIAQKTFEKDSIFGQAMELGLLETIGAGYETAEKYPERIRQITSEQIQQTAKRYFIENTMTDARLWPQ